MKTQSKNPSRREKDVIELLLQGKSNKQIALALGITESTVEFHLKNVYAKLQVSSRAEAILKLGKSIGLINEQLRESIVEKEGEINHTGGQFISEKPRLATFGDNFSSIRKDAEMKNRLFSYFFAGLVFGVLFWIYLEAIDRFMNTLSINEEYPLEVWRFISIEFLLIFGVWLIPTIYAVRQEFRQSKKVSLSVMAVILSWIGAVFGYYLFYLVLLAFIGLPNMEYYLIFGERGPRFWQDWAELFPRLILFKFLQWSVVGAIVGGLAGFVTSSLYSFWEWKTNRILPA